MAARCHSPRDPLPPRRFASNRYAQVGTGLFDPPGQYGPGGPVSWVDIPASAKRGLRRPTIESVTASSIDLRDHGPALLGLPEDLADAADFSAVLRLLVHHVVRALDHDSFAIYLTDDEGGLALQAASVKTAQRRIEFGDTPIGVAAMTKAAVHIADTAPGTRADSKSTVPRSIIAVPILLNDTVIGVIASGHALPGFFTERDVFLVSALAAMAAPALAERVLAMAPLAKTQAA